jgi:hypothetical protein
MRDTTEVNVPVDREGDRDALRRALLEGAASEQGPVADEAYFEALRGRIGA